MAKKDSSANGCTQFLIILTFLIFLIVTAISIYGSGPPEDDPIVMKKTVREVLDAYPVDVTPGDWVWLIWLGVWFYLLLWLFYSSGLICRQPGDGKGYLYSRPPFIPVAVYGAFILSQLAIVGWLYLWTAELFRWALLTIGAVIIGAAVALFFAIRGLHKYGDDLYHLGNGSDVVADRLLVQNSLGMYSMWVLFIGLLNMTIALVYKWDMDQVDASSVFLASFGGIVIIYFFVDILVYERPLRYLLTPYIVFTVVMSAVLAKEFDGGDRNFILSLFLVGFAGFATLFKIASMISHARRREHHNDSDKEKLLHEDSCDDDDDDEDEELEVNDAETAKYIKQAQLLLSAK